MIKIGLTGGIGSGKTLLSNLFEIHRIPVYIADQESKRLTDNSPEIRRRLISLLGNKIYSDTGLNRPLLASLIFSDSNLLKAVNAIIHPEVKKDFIQWTKHQECNLCVIESAILYESRFDLLVDKRLMVYAPLEIRIQRVCERNNLSREEVEKRIKNQLSDESKVELSDFVIINDNKQAVIPQMHEFLSTIGHL